MNSALAELIRLLAEIAAEQAFADQNDRECEEGHPEGEPEERSQ